MRSQISLPWFKLVLTLVILLALLISAWFFVEHHTTPFGISVSIGVVLLLVYLIQIGRLHGSERYTFIDNSFYRSLYLLIGLGVMLLWATWTV